MFKTADLCDEYPQEVQVAQPLFRDYGGAPTFGGPIATVKVDDDNAPVRQLLETPGAGRVLVVDNGGSLRCALVGDRLAQLAITNGWAGIVVYGCIRDSAEAGRDAYRHQGACHAAAQKLQPRAEPAEHSAPICRPRHHARPLPIRRPRRHHRRRPPPRHHVMGELREARGEGRRNQSTINHQPLTINHSLPEPHPCQWFNEPPSWSREDDAILMTAGPSTDFWRKTHYGFIRDSGHVYFQTVAGDFTAEVKVSGGYKDLYDQAGLMLRIDESNWIKCGIESSTTYSTSAPSSPRFLGLVGGGVGAEPASIWLRRAQGGGRRDFLFAGSRAVHPVTHGLPPAR